MNKIIEGFTNLIIKDKEVEIIAKQRLDICNECPFMQTLLGLKFCGWCQCSIQMKTRSPNSECPIGKWK